MRKPLHHISIYIHKYPARITGYMSAISLNAMKYWEKVPVGIMIPVAMLLIMMGEGAQRMEDKKTIQALYTNNEPNKQDEKIIDEMMERIA
jgi:hypothetical protein